MLRNLWSLFENPDVHLASTLHSSACRTTRQMETGDLVFIGEHYYILTDDSTGQFARIVVDGHNW